VANGFPDKIQFDIKSAIEAGLNEEDIARHVSNRRNYDYDSARKAGLTNSDIIAYNVEGVRDISRLRAFRDEAVLSGFTTGAASYKAGKEGFKAGLKLPGGPWVKFIGAIGGGLIGGAAGAIAGEFGKQKIKEAAGIEGQLTPSRRPFEVAGETFGFIGAGTAPVVGKGLLRKANEALAKRAGLEGFATKTKFASDLDIAMPDLGSAAFIASAGDNPTMNAALKRAMGKGLGATEQFFGKAYEGAVKRPITTLVAETAGGLSAASGAALAETLDPGDLSSRLTAELVLGVGNPTAILLNRGSQLIKNVFSSVTGGNERELNRVASALSAVIDDAPEDIRPDLDAIIKSLVKNLSPEEQEIFAAARPAAADKDKQVPLFTSAEKTGDEFLSALQEVVAQRDPKTAALMMRRAKQGNKAISNMIETLMESDDKTVLAIASKMQEEQFNKSMETLLNVYVTKAMDRASRVAATTDEEYAAANRSIVDTITTALTKAREIESTLYKNVDNKIELNATNVLKAYLDELNPAKGGFPEKAIGFDKTVRQFIQRIAPDVKDAELDLISKIQLEIAEIESTALPILSQVDETGDRLQRAVSRALGNDGDTVKTLRNIQTQDDLTRLEDELRSMQTQARADNGELEGLARESRPALTRQKNAALKLAKKSLALNTTQRRVMEAADQAPEATKVTAGDLIGFRSHVLKLARQGASDSNRASEAGFYSKLANAAGEDIGTRSLGRMTPEEIAAMDPARLEAIKNLDAAYSFSKSLNDVFTRGFGGTLYAKNAKGGNRLIPELAADKLRASTGLPSSIRMKELDDAVEFVIREAPDAERAELELLKGTLRGSEEVLMRRLARDRNIVDSTTGEIKVNALNTFLRDQGEMLQTYFPRLFEDLQDAGKAQVMLSSAREKAQKVTNRLDPNKSKDRVIASFKTFLGADESPWLEVKRVLGVPGQDPARNAVRNLNRLIDFTEKARFAKADPNFVGPPRNEVQEGLKETIYDSAWMYAGGGSNQDVNFSKLRQYLMGPIDGRSGPSIMNVLEKRGVASADEVKNWTAFFNAAESFQRTLDSGDAAAIQRELIDQPSAISGLIARVIGSGTVSGLAAKFGLRSNIAIPSAGAKFSADLANKLPYGKAWEVITEAAKDPVQMAALLKRTKNKREFDQVYGRLKSVLRTVGGRALTDYLEFSDYEGKPTAQLQPRRSDFDRPAPRPMPRPAAPAPQPAPQAQARPQPQPAPRPAAPAPQPASSSAESRARFAQMYPFDITSDIIRSGG